MTRTGAPAPRPGRGGQSLLAAVVAVPVVAAAVGLGVAASTAFGPAEDHASSTSRVAGRPAADRPPAAVAVAMRREVVQNGTRAVLSVRPAPDDPGEAEIRLRLGDAVTGAPLEVPSRPMAWADLRAAPAPPGGGRPAPDCDDKVRAYRSGGLGSAAEIDLNAYDVLTLNGDGTISVVDPLADVGGMTQLRAQVVLGSPGEDWTTSADGRRLFVTLPEAGEVAVVDLDSFRLTSRIDVGGQPVRAALDPGGQHLWVTDDSLLGGVSVVDTSTFEVVHTVRTGRGPHTLAFTGPEEDWTAAGTASRHSGEDHHVSSLVTDAQEQDDAGADDEHRPRVLVGGSDGAVAVVDPATFGIVAGVQVGAPVTDLATLDVTGDVYAAGGPDGPVTVLDAADGSVVSRLDHLVGTTTMRFAPGGRWGFAVAGARDRLTVVDARTDAVVHTEHGIGRSPDRVVFTDGYAYVHSERSAEVAVVDLARVGSGARLPFVRVSGGQRPPAEGGGTAVADPIFPLHAGEALFANPSDSFVYSYMEGMNAPMGGHQSYAPAPRAVRVVDRSLREVGPGEHVVQVRLPRPGDYELALLVGSPRVLACFDFSARAPVGTRAPSAGVRLAVPPSPTTTTAGTRTSFRFALAEDTREAAPVDADDVLVIGTEAAGRAGDRAMATSLGDGRYEVELVLGRPGSYSLRIGVASRGVEIGDVAPTTVRVADR